MKWILYCTTCIVNNKIYVGVHKTENPNIFDGYIGCGVKITIPSSYMHPTTPFQSAVKKYGTKNFKRAVLKIFDDEISAYRLESEIVTKEFINRKDVYNAHLGGLGGGILKKVFQFSLEGEYLKEWDSLKDASDFYSVSSTSIGNGVKFKTSSQGYYWSFEQKIDISEYSNNIGTKCYKYDGDTLKYIESYNSLPNAAKINNIRLMVLERGVKGGYKIGNFYYSTTLSDFFEPISKVSLKNKPLYVYSLAGEFIIELQGSSEICNFFQIKSTSSITTAIRTKRQYKSYQLSLEKVDKLDPISDKKNKSYKIGKYSLTGDLLETFDSITQAREKYGSGVTRVLKGQQTHCKNFIFKKL